MNTHLTSALLLAPYPTKPKLAAAPAPAGTNRLGRWWQRFLRALCSSSDLRIRYYGELHGQIWRVYDPISRRSTWLSSEDEVRRWIEQRYYQ